MTEALCRGNLEIRLVPFEHKVVIRWAGEADDRDPGRSLGPFLDQACTSAVAQGRTVVFDLTRVTFMNSSGIGLVMAQVKVLDEQGAPVEVHFDTRNSWQLLSMRCTRTIFARSSHVKVADLAQPV